jgi:hypothetical protein
MKMWQSLFVARLRNSNVIILINTVTLFIVSVCMFLYLMIIQSFLNKKCIIRILSCTKRILTEGIECKGLSPIAGAMWLSLGAMKNGGGKLFCIIYSVKGEYSPGFYSRYQRNRENKTMT